MLNFCAVMGCGMRSDQDKGVSFYRLPAEISHQGEMTEELTKNEGLCGWQEFTEVT